MSDSKAFLLDKLSKKQKPAVKKEINIKYAKTQQDIKINTEIKDKRPISKIDRESVLKNIGIKKNITSQISTKQLDDQPDDEDDQADQPDDQADQPDDQADQPDDQADQYKLAEAIAKTTFPKSLSQKSKDLEDLEELDEEALLAALESSDEAIGLKSKTGEERKEKKATTNTKTTKSLKILTPKNLTKKISVKESHELLVEEPDNIESLKEKMPKKDNLVKIKASQYYLNNREIFVNFINSLLDTYQEQLSKETFDCNKNNNESFSLLTHQSIVRDYINLLTPYRGLLLFHGLGSGKTCSSIAIAEGLKSDKEIIIMLPKSLETNYKQELKKCGDELYRNNQHWEFINTNNDPTLIDPLAYLLSLSPVFIKKMGGAWMINMKKPSNYSTLSNSQQINLNAQIDKMLDNKYKFIRYNGLRQKRLDQLVSDAGGNPFNNKVIIVDEAHNLISRIVNKLKRPKSLAMQLYSYLKTAENCKIVLLTGTPIINYPHEAAIMMNILRGDIKTWKFQLKNEGKFKLTKESLIELFKKNSQTGFILDYINFKSTPEPVLTITRNPYGFYTQTDSKSGEYLGVTLGESGNISDEMMIKILTETLLINGVKIVSESVTNYNCLPDNQDEFISLFIDSVGKIGIPSLKNMDLFKKRILGLVSYFPDIEKLLPRYRKSENFKIVLVPMSGFQFAIYEEARAEERKIERNNAKKRIKKGNSANGLYEESVSTYRIFSRAFCNFVFPRPEINRPLPRDSGKISGIINENTNEDLLDAVIVEEQLGEDLDDTSIKEVLKDELPDEKSQIITTENIKDNTSYANRIQKAIKMLDERRDEFLTPEALEIYSPKFLNILSRLLDDEYYGLHLIYSQFRTLEGIAILSLVLKTNGFAQFKISKINGEWRINIKEEDKDKPKFILYTGTELPEEKEILRNIFNSNWEALNTPELVKLKAELLTYGDNNYYGSLIKIIMITASGAEGISLSNVRYVHITEPYWHPVRINQVIGRARRICSHKNLPEQYQTVEVFLYLMELTQEQIDIASNELKQQDKSKLNQEQYMKYKSTQDPYLTSDQALFEISSQKEIITQGILTNMKEASIDCNLHNDIGGTEQLKCFTFGQPNPYKFGYYPSIQNQEQDTTSKMNKKQVTLELKNVKLEGKGYAYNANVLKKENEDSNKIISSGIYSLESIKTGSPIMVGTLFFKNSAKDDEEPKYKPNNYTFFAEKK